MTKRTEMLRAVSEAATVFADSPSGARTSFDIIGAVAARNIPLLFRPLDKLWGRVHHCQRQGARHHRDHQARVAGAAIHARS